MKFITGTLFILNIILWLSAVIVCFVIYGFSLGIPCIIGFSAFLIAWKISSKTTVSAADYFFQPEWNVFVKKIEWANSTGTMTVAGVYLIALFTGLAENIFAQ